jgi:hypothetical protein
LDIDRKAGYKKENKRYFKKGKAGYNEGRIGFNHHLNLYKFFSLDMGNRDPRYSLIKPMITGGKITSFTDIFKFIPKTVVANDLGKKVDRFTELMKNVEGFTLEELFVIAKFCDIDKSEMLKLAENEYIISKSKIKRTKRP